MSPVSRHRARPPRVSGVLGLLLLLVGVSVPGQVRDSAPEGTVITNRAVVRAADVNGNALVELTPEASLTVSGAGRLTLEKVSVPAVAAPGELVEYRLRFANTGNLAITEATLEDRLPDGVEFVEASSEGAVSADGARVTWRLGPLAAGERGEVTLTVRLAPAGSPSLPAEGGVLRNLASLTTALGEVQAAVETLVGSAPRLVLSKSVTPERVLPGGVLTYTMLCRNTGNVAAADVVIRDSLPEGLALESVPNGATLDGRVLSWRVGALEPGEDRTVSFAARVSPLMESGALVRNVAAALERSGAVVESNPAVALVSGGAALSVVKEDRPDPVHVGNPIYYTIRVRNTGDIPLTGIQVRDPVPSGTTLSDYAAGGVVTAGAVVWTLARLEPGAEQAFDLTVVLNRDLPEGSVIRNSAEVTTHETPVPVGSSATTVSARTPGTIGFYTDQWTPASSYRLGSRICVQVADADRDLDPAALDTVVVVLVHDGSGDREEVVLTETGPSTGVFRGCVSSTGGEGVPDNGVLSLAVNTSISAEYTDPLDTAPVSRDVALIDPFGVVFDTVSNLPVAGATVRLLQANGAPASVHPDWPAGQADEVVTPADGTFAFPLVPVGTYRLEVVPGGGYSFPSAVPTADMPAGRLVVLGSRGELFTLAAGDPPLNLDIPVDPPAGELRVTKTANRSSATVGDLVTYEIRVDVVGGDVLGVVVEDWFPEGLQYLPGTSTRDGVTVADPVPVGGGLRWPVGDLSAGARASLQFRALVGPGAGTGRLRNQAEAGGTGTGGAVRSPVAVHELQVSAGVFTDRAVLFGKVFTDRNRNGVQDPGEPGVPGVTLYLEDGTWVVTDDAGKYSIRSIEPGTHVLRLDTDALPEGLVPTGGNTRFAGNPRSQFVSVDPGMPAKADFPLALVPVVPVQALEAATAAPTEPDTTDVSAAEMAISAPAPEPELQPGVSGPEPLSTDDLESRFAQLDSELAFLTPSDGQLLPGTRARVLVKGPAAGRIVLYVHDTPVPDDRIGRTLTDAERGVRVVEYIGVELPAGGESPLRITFTDPFGNLRGEAEIRVRTTGEPAAIVFEDVPAGVPADGRTVTSVQARVVDSGGNTVPLRGMLTCELSDGELLSKDADPGAPGHQVPLENGAATLELQSSRTPGKAVLRVVWGSVSADTELRYKPELRDLMVVGVGELTLGLGSADSGFPGLIGADNDWFEDGPYAGGRGAVFVKGQVAEDTVLTAAYDTHKRQRDDFFREWDQDLDEESKYPIYGDESRTGYEAQSRDKLYLRLDRGESHVLYGDFETDFSETRLSRYTRTFTGLEGQAVAGPLTYRGFVAESDQVQHAEALAGRGISGYYYLANTPVIPGSERVRIETRDRRRPDLVLQSREMIRETDYELEYDTGAILFREPVPIRDGALNPVYVVVTYESEGQGQELYTYGGRVTLDAHERLRLGVTGVVEENEIRDRALAGADLQFALPGRTVLRLEAAGTRSLFADTGVLVQGDGSAWSAELEGEPVRGLKLGAWYREADDLFDNPSATDVRAGIRDVGLEASYDLGLTTTLTAGANEQRDSVNDATYKRATVGVEKRLGDSTVGVELIRERSEDAYVPPGLPGSRHPFDISAETPDELTGLHLYLDTPVTRRLRLELDHTQDIEYSRYSLSGAGLTYQLDPTRKLYLREEVGRYDDRTETRTVFGIESEVFKDTVGFNEYRLADAMEGHAAEQGIGIRNKFAFGPGLSGTLSAENLHTISGDERAGEPDGYALASGVTYLPVERLRLTTRFEHRDTDEETSTLAEFGTLLKLSPSYSLFTRTRHFNEHFEDAGARVATRALLGLAFRPAAWDRFNALAKFEYKHEEDDTNSTLPERADSYVGSAEGVYQVSPEVQLRAKYAGKYVSDLGAGSYMDLVGAGVRYDVTEFLDVGAGYRMLHAHETETLAHGGYVEVGVRAYRDFWVSLGYSFDRFDADLTGAAYEGRGCYLKLRLKVDENSLDPLLPGRRAEARP